jgi:hypothetical protein
MMVRRDLKAHRLAHQTFTDVDALDSERVRGKSADEASG